MSSPMDGNKLFFRERFYIFAVCLIFNVQTFFFLRVFYFAKEISDVFGSKRVSNWGKMCIYFKVVSNEVLIELYRQQDKDLLEQKSPDAHTTWPVVCLKINVTIPKEISCVCTLIELKLILHSNQRQGPSTSCDGCTEQNSPMERPSVYSDFLPFECWYFRIHVLTALPHGYHN